MASQPKSHAELPKSHSELEGLLQAERQRAFTDFTETRAWSREVISATGTARGIDPMQPPIATQSSDLSARLQMERAKEMKKYGRSADPVVISTGGRGVGVLPHSVALGRSGLVTSPMGFGCMGMTIHGAPMDDEAASSLLRSAFEAGCTHFDTSESYRVTLGGGDVVFNEQTV